VAPTRAPAHPRVREVDLAWQSVATVMAAFIALVAVTGLVRSAGRTLSAIVVASLIALALSPLVRAIEAKIGREWRGAAVALVLAGLTLLLAVAGLVLAPRVIRQAAQLPAEAPTVVAGMRDLPFVGDDLVRADAPARVERWIEELPHRLAGDATPIARAGRSFVDGMVAAVVMLLLATALLVDGPRLGRRVAALVPPAYTARFERSTRLAYGIVGRYIAGSLVVSGVAGVVVLIAGLALGVPLTPLLALWVALWDLVPQIGGAVGGAPFVLFAFTAGVGAGLACLVLFLVYQQVKHQVIGPVLIGNAVKLSPPATMIAALIGISAAGVVGGLVAVPVAGATKAIYLELRAAA
jgi:predicted PurR-regulated permease PerM